MGKVPLVDDPFWRDWLFWVVLVGWIPLFVAGLVRFDLVRAAGAGVMSFAFLVLVAGSIRQLVRGYREPRRPSPEGS